MLPPRVPRHAKCVENAKAHQWIPILRDEFDLVLFLAVHVKNASNAIVEAHFEDLREKLN